MDLYSKVVLNFISYSIIADPDPDQTPATAEAVQTNEEEEGKYVILSFLSVSVLISE